MRRDFIDNCAQRAGRQRAAIDLERTSRTGRPCEREIEMTESKPATEALAVELGPDVRVNAVTPAVVKTRSQPRSMRIERINSRQRIRSSDLASLMTLAALWRSS
jgi:hypothetical protein